MISWRGAAKGVVIRGLFRGGARLVPLWPPQAAAAGAESRALWSLSVIQFRADLRNRHPATNATPLRSVDLRGEDRLHRPVLAFGGGA